MKFRNLAYGASTVAIMLSASTAVFAQETTGGIRGLVTDAAGAPVANAEITITHVPSGTSSTTATDQVGAYSARNLRVGGPYIITVSSSAGSSTTEAGSIGIGTPASVDIIVGGGAFSDDAADLGDVVVTGQRAGGLRTSPRTNISLNDIETLPTVSRDIKDFVRTSPFATVDPTNNDALSIGGQNTRANAFLVDGVRQSDDFGLNGNGYPTQRSPISIDTLEAVSVDVAPYGVQYGSFTGGVINSVTKSGGNDFHGTAFWETTNDGLRGNSFSFEDFVTGQRQDRTVAGTFEEETWGASLSGPIIRDKLFFYLNYEKFDSTQPVLSGPQGSGSANEVPGITQADVDTVRQIARDVYGYDPLDWSADALEVSDEKYFAKLDWNINDRHRAVASYQQTDSGDLNLNGTTTGGNYPSLGLLSSAYSLQQNIKVYKAQLFSDWTDTFSTEFSVSRKESESISTSLAGSDFAAFQVYLDNPTGTQVGPERSIRFGPERSRHANSLTVDTTLYRAVANWDVGYGHRLTGGYEREEQDIFNLFVQVANGEYEFASLADFRARRASSIGYTNAASNNKNDGAAAFSYALNTLFVQDEWAANEDLTITAGLRLDWYTSDDEPQFNQGFQNRFGFANDTSLDGIFVLQPRFGFNWRASDDLTVYGGFGRFQGGSPNVWISNSYSNPGNLTGSFQCRTAATYSSNFATSFPVCSAAEQAALLNVDGFNVNQVAKDRVTTSANLGTGNINLIDPSFETPSIWKTSLGVNKRFDFSRFNLGDAWNVTAEYVHSELENTVGWVDLSLLRTQNGTAPDGRPVFGPNPVRTGQQVLMLTNVHGGQSDQFAVALSKDWYDGWLNGTGFNLSYTYLDATDPSAGTSSTASSNFGNIAVSDPNMPPLATSNYEIEHALKLSLSYQRAFFGDYRTRFALFAQRRSGLPFSYTYSSGTLFGDYTSANRNLLYVPQVDASGNVTATSDPIVTYAPTFNVTAFNDFLKRTGLIDFAGGISPRNAFNSPYVTTVDIHIEQELPAFFPGGARLTGYLDIENFGNLLNDEWGTIQQIGFPYISNNVGATRNAANTQYTYNAFTERSPSSFTAQSVWQMKFGVRYRF
ncbi:TonB-dependent receptor [Brevundimonas sp. PAMC22021]|uniref:TonB-dependent receptor n=1 Tax=Brevundimonas sp. PAMC22021 TaxID=2861285 RepID=UPI001C629AC0|nr:TonB-dependent receptor [Brevundimonas sp. PAMC22021]QYF86495.1 TonB-dependent receptor [Brevundimonas sp. PAMC22021]